MLRGKTDKILKHEKRKGVFLCGPCGPYWTLCKILRIENLKPNSDTM